MATTTDFDFDFDFTIEPPKIEEVIQPTKTDYETSLANATGEMLFNPADYPLKEKTWHDKVLDSHKRIKIHITTYTVGKVKIVYNGSEYKAELVTTMHGKGFEYWKELYEKEIALARALCYARHVITYGNYGQVIPPQAKEYFTLRESQVARIQQEQSVKELNIDIDSMVFKEVKEKIEKEEEKELKEVVVEVATKPEEIIQIEENNQQI